jgi:putative (di)nucleoside polyphosphate hydrolase
LSRYVPRNEHRNRFLRQGLRPIDLDQSGPDMPDATFEMPPGASYEPDPCTGCDHES